MSLTRLKTELPGEQKAVVGVSYTQHGQQCVWIDVADCCTVAGLHTLSTYFDKIAGCQVARM